MPSTSPIRERRRHLVERLSGDERHGQRWHLQVPCPGEPYRTARPLILVLGVPTLGLAFGISVLTTYGPVVLARLTSSSTQIGALIGGEGAFALAIPVVSGALSDRLGGSPRRRRLPFVAAGAPLVAFGLVLLPFGHSYVLAGAAVLAFYVGYYLYYPPYRALYADLLPRELYARAQASQAVLRGSGLGVALLAGGLLLGLWAPLPFLLAAAAVVAATLPLLQVLRLESDCPNETLPYRGGSVRALLADGGMRAFAAANALWEFSFAGLKSFIVLYVVRGLGHSPAVASAVMAVVAVAYVVGAPVAGQLADRYGLTRVLRIAATVYGAGLVAGVLPHTLLPMLVGLPFVALAGAIVMTLPQALAFSLAPRGAEGAVAGLQDFSRGVGVVVGPIAVGAAVDAARHTLTSTHGYAAMWLVIGVPVLASVLLLLRVREADGSTARQNRTDG
ncbi:MAG TPA: MFS transporter [Gaiellaceae bacterium]